MRTVTPSTLKVYLVQSLRESILSGKYRPGDRMNESRIAREFGISRIPVREALFQLQESGFVTNHKGKGMFVTRLSEQDAQMINGVRLVLETEAFKLARAHITAETAAALTSLVDRMEAWKGELAGSAAMDLEFHRTVWSLSDNPYLVKTLETLTTVLFAHKMLEHGSFELNQWRLHHHRALLEVILSPAPQDIRGALLTHLRMSPSAHQPCEATGATAPAAGTAKKSVALSGVRSAPTASGDPLRF
ncbi:MAG: GntR family transcriptional regulator [Terracidiphilus sp.]